MPQGQFSSDTQMFQTGDQLFRVHIQGKLTNSILYQIHTYDKLNTVTIVYTISSAKNTEIKNP